MIIKNSSLQYDTYNQLIHPGRLTFMNQPGLKVFISEQNPQKLNAFLIIWTFFSIKMTEQVESWIERAGQNCLVKNLDEIGNKLARHAQQEADHDKMLVNDLDFLIRKWNFQYQDQLSINDLMQIALPSASEQYVALHENVISSDYPYAQIAIEFEIERISVQYGPKMLENILFTLGKDFENGLSFLTDHVLLDQGHTKFNADLLERCFKANGKVDTLVETGHSALTIYSRFLNQCALLSEKIATRGLCLTTNTNL